MNRGRQPLRIFIEGGGRVYLFVLGGYVVLVILFSWLVSLWRRR